MVWSNIRVSVNCNKIVIFEWTVSLNLMLFSVFFTENLSITYMIPLSVCLSLFTADFTACCSNV